MALEAWRKTMEEADLVPLVLIARTAGEGKRVLVCVPAGPHQTDAEIIDAVCRMADTLRRAEKVVRGSIDEFRREVEGRG